MLHNIKYRTGKFNISGVYTLKSSECNSIYVSQTERNFKIRYERYRSHEIKPNQHFQIPI